MKVNQGHQAEVLRVLLNMNCECLKVTSTEGGVQEIVKHLHFRRGEENSGCYAYSLLEVNPREVSFAGADWHESEC